MGDALNILPYVKTPDFVSPLEAALRMHESRQNAETQRMYAQNQMARESAQEFRENRDYEEKQKDKERQDKLEAAKAVGTISQMLGPRDEKGRPVNLGPAMALGSVYGIDLHPLLATTAAAHAAQGDAVDQALAEAGPTGNAPPAAPQAPPAGPGADSSIPRETPGVDPGVAAIMQGRTVQSAPEGDFVLPPGTPANLAAASAHTGYVPQGSELLPPQARPPAPPPPVPAGPPPELEALMAGAHPEFAGAKYEAPTNPLYDAVMGGQHYQLGGQASGEVLGGKYDTIAQALISRGIPAKDAYVKALAEKEKDDSIAATAQRMKDALAGHNAETDKRDAQFRLTAEEQQARDAMRDATSRRNADVGAGSRERVAGAGGGDVSSEIAGYLTAHPGDVEGATKIAESHNIHGQKAAALVGGIATDMGKKPPTAGGIDKSKIVRDLDGTPRGIAPSGRGGAASLQSDLRTNEEALDKLIKLRRKDPTIAIGPDYHDAILALAAVTTAGKTDLTTHHEEGAITNWTGKMISTEGLDNKINQLRTRMEEIRHQLAPLPEGYTEERAGASAGKKLSPGELAGGSFLP